LQPVEWFDEQYSIEQYSMRALWLVVAALEWFDEQYSIEQYSMRALWLVAVEAVLDGQREIFACPRVQQHKHTTR
jgi:hypothetical protein